MKETKIISAYPCCGKTYAFENYQDIYSILDSDSSDFSWIYRERTDDELQKIKEDFESMLSPTNADKELERIRCEKIKERNPDFPNNYIEHIKENIGKVDYIFVSSHLVVRQALESTGIKYFTIYPEIELLDEWVGRMYRRGNDKSFIDFQIKHWNEFVNGIDTEPHGESVRRLKSGQHITDVMF